MSLIRCLVCILSLVITLSLVSFAHGQTTQAIPRIGFLAVGNLSTSAPRLKVFRERLQELGYIEGENFIIEDRFAEREFDRVPTLAAELVDLKVNVIITSGGMDTRAIKNATSTIPIVMAQDPDPVASGFVASLAQPGGNITGSAIFGPGIAGKRVGLLKQSVPKLSRLAVFGISGNPVNSAALKEVERAAQAHGVTDQYVEVINLKEIDKAFRAAKYKRADAVLLLPGPFFSERKRIANLAIEGQFPMIFDRPQFANAGGLMSYGADVLDLYRQAATYVDLILRGAKPADLPIKQPSKFEFVINLKTAETLGLNLPQSILLQATEVIE